MLSQTETVVEQMHAYLFVIWITPLQLKSV